MSMPDTPEPPKAPSNVVALRPVEAPTHGSADTQEKPVTRQCTARSSQSGKRCRRHAIKGGTVCATHGGSAPKVKERARLRLAALVDPAITTLAREMTTAANSNDRQRAANSILDRAGLSRGVSPEVEVARLLLIERLTSLQQSAKQ
ncbi:hypothetical protein QDA04_gp90 [Microbacterium phage Megan]|uniref:Uncharacterized protein n=1 Tax=Microbacterium phage Megan TaxID=2656551 RepID=A0A649VK42_9CAUD|nr:hypothetical protein QDA04_gp90 [Microbacterium phage Megan]QGJ92760.1 hypothetical protein PBI_MEGAN_90 [Microbacterium phage Megan]